jgi:hypothetical protein
MSIYASVKRTTVTLNGSNVDTYFTSSKGSYTFV